MVHICDLCGRQVEGATMPLEWSVSMELGRVRRYCEVCTRAHARAMEAGLDQDFW
jgi:hypothetical protein